MRHTLMILLFLFVLIVVKGQDCSRLPIFKIGQVYGQVGDTVQVPITAYGYQNILGHSFKLSTNVDEIEVIGLSLNPTIDLNSDLLSGILPDQIAISFFSLDFTPFNLSDGDVLITLEVIILTDIDYSPISYFESNSGIAAELSSGDFLVLPYAFIDGGVGTVPQTDVLQLDSILICNTSCDPSNNGSAAVFLSPASSYTYSWQDENGQELSTSNALSNIPSGDYQLQVTFPSGVSTNIHLELELDPHNLSISNINVAKASCEADDGAAYPIIDYPWDDLNYQWSTGDTSLYLTDVPAGEYTITVTTVNTGCVAVESVIIPERAEIYFTGSAVRQVICDEDQTGSIEIELSGPDVNGVDFEWNDGTLTKDRAGLSPGNYTLSVTNFAGCEVSRTFEVPHQPNLQLFADVINVDCPTPVRYIDLQAPRQGFSMSYLWSDLSTIEDQFNLDLGQYNVTVHDPGNNCTGVLETTLSEPIFDYDFSYTCSGSTLTFWLGYTPDLVFPITYVWSTGDVMSDTNLPFSYITANPDEDYQLAIIDALGCQYVTESFTTTCEGNAQTNGNNNQFNPLMMSTHGLSFNVGSLDANQGEQICIPIEVTEMEDIEAFDFSLNWDPALLTFTGVNIIDSTFVNTVFYRDYYPQIGFNWQELTGNRVTLDSTTTAYELCFTVIGSADTAPIQVGSYPLSPSYTHSSNTSSNVGISTGLVHISCDASINASVENVNHPTNAAANNGSILLNQPNGYPPFSYEWYRADSLIATNNTRVLQNMPSGEYDVFIQDHYNCTTVINDILLLTPIQNDTLICEGDSLQLSINQVDAISYSWTPSNLLSCSDCPNPVTMPLYTPTTFDVTVTDNMGMDSSYSIFVDVRSYLDFGLLSFSNSPVCIGNDLLLDANVSNAQVYEWTYPGGNFTSSLSNPIITDVTENNAGVYEIYLVDDIGCEANASFTVEVGPDFDIQPDIFDDDCEGECNGLILLNITGGNAPYEVSWDNGVSWIQSTVFNELCPGDYSILIRDANCQDTYDFSIGTSNAITADVDLITTPTCNNPTEATILISNVNGGGGNGNYAYSIDNGITFIPFTSPLPLTIPSITSQVVIQDDAGCQSIFPLDIFIPSPISAMVQITNASCLTNAGGTAIIVLDGATNPLNYQWDTGNAPDLNNLTIGSYQFTVTDANNCITSASFEITDNPIANLTPDTLICLGDSVQLEAVVPDAISTLWSPQNGLTNFAISNPVAYPDSTTLYVITAENEENCVGTDSVLVGVFPGVDCIDEFWDTLSVNLSNSWCSPIAEAWPVDYEIEEVISSMPGVFIDLSFDNQTPCIIYEGLAIGTDSVYVRLCASDNSTQCVESFLYITVTEDEVWPGDTDYNGIVNNFDLLPIGLAYDSTGPARPGATLDWVAQPAPNWPQTLAAGTNYKHIDTNGEGLISADDTTAIVLNWGEVHNFSSGDEENRLPGTVPFYIRPDTIIEGSTISMPVVLGEMDSEAEDVYGLAFSLFYDPDIVKDDSAFFNMNESWIGDPNDNAIFIQRDFSTAGRLDVGITKIDGINENGYGQIGAMIIVIEDDIVLRSSAGALFEIGNVRIIDFDENELDINTPVTEAPIISVVSHTDESILPTSDIVLYPNPNKGAFRLHHPGIPLKNLQLFDIKGNLYHSWEPVQEGGEYLTNKPAPGVYLLRIQTSKATVWKKMVIID